MSTVRTLWCASRAVVLLFLFCAARRAHSSVSLGDEGSGCVLTRVNFLSSPGGGFDTIRLLLVLLGVLQRTLLTHSIWTINFSTFYRPYIIMCKKRPLKFYVHFNGSSQRFNGHSRGRRRTTSTSTIRDSYHTFGRGAWLLEG
jgi:hypothetical protein